MAWSDAKAAARSAQLDIWQPVLPAGVARWVSDLRIIAGAQSFTAAGTETDRRIIAEADDIERAARCMMIPAQETYRHAH